jgi:hypothetical protein
MIVNKSIITGDLQLYLTVFKICNYLHPALHTRTQRSESYRQRQRLLAGLSRKDSHEWQIYLCHEENKCINFSFIFSITLFFGDSVRQAPYAPDIMNSFTRVKQPRLRTITSPTAEVSTICNSFTLMLLICLHCEVLGQSGNLYLPSKSKPVIISLSKS